MSGYCRRVSGGAGLVSDRRGGVEPSEVPVWSVANSTGASPAAADPLRRARTGSAAPTGSDARRRTLRPRSGFVVALLVFFAAQAANAWVAWYEAPIRTDDMVDAIVAYLICGAAVVPALALRGRWRVIPVLLATLAGAIVPVALSRDLMDAVGPRSVWVGQSLTLQVMFPLLLGLLAAGAVVSAPRLRTEP